MCKKPSWRSSTTILRIKDDGPSLAIPAKPSFHTCRNAKSQNKTERIHNSNGGVGCTPQRKRRGPRRRLNKSVTEEDDIPLAMLAYQKGIALDKAYMKSQRHSSPSYLTSPLPHSSKPVSSFPRKRKQAEDGRSGQMLCRHRHSSPSTMQNNSHHKVSNVYNVERRSITSETSTMKAQEQHQCNRFDEKLSGTPEISASSKKSQSCLSCFKFKHWSICLIKKMFQKKIAVRKLASM